eukprot:gnl/MRDRNA2_/MRDRNA2_31137_c0_seq2.p1 gnl/MRDRNA2_/MRDRNA2_31137_c0~~gnl/MRDRNA2_/MRDRNA2_31137_c0_seq2.p1  ORF type:complete len:422 (-),score=93.92 gnl/MRDRNA2_/MRDRNA2_31137_c0_seq2:235-1500(-)
MTAACFTPCAGALDANEVQFNVETIDPESDMSPDATSLMQFHFEKKITKVYDVRKMAKDFEEAAQSLQLALQNYKKLVREKQQKGLVHFRGSAVDFANLPVHMVARRVFRLFTILVEDQVIRRQDTYFTTKENVQHMLEVLDLNPDINGRLKQIHGEKEKLELVTQLLILMVIQPSHDEILTLAGGDKVEEEKRQKVGEQVDLDFKQDFVLDHTHAKVVMAPKSIISDLWEAIDVNGDGYVEAWEVRRWFRTIMSRPTLGALLLEKVLHSKKHAGWASDENVHRAMLYCFPPLVTELAKHVTEEGDKMWKSMDTDGDLKVSKEEFHKTFRKALKVVILKPLKNSLVDKCKPEKREAQAALGQEIPQQAPEIEEEGNWLQRCCGSRKKLPKLEDEEESDSDADHYLPLQYHTTGPLVSPDIN